MPSPQRSSRQVGAQPSHATWFPSSHCSPTSTLPFPHTAVFGAQTSVTAFERIRAPSPSWAAMLNVFDPENPAGCGTTRPNVVVQSLRCVIGAPGTSTFVPALTVRPRVLIAFTNVTAFATSTDAVALSGLGLLIESDAT